jgi:MoxR-like ATPase
VGKTTAAEALAAVLDTPLIRRQCYEGHRRRSAIRLELSAGATTQHPAGRARGATIEESDLYETYLVDRPILACAIAGRGRRCC